MHLLVRPTALVAFAIVVLTTALALLFATGGDAQEGGGTVRDPGPNVQEILDDLPHLRDALEANEPVMIIADDRPDPAARAREHGPFRIIPQGFVGVLPTTKVAGAPLDVGANTTDRQLVTASPLWRHPPLPDDFELSATDTFGIRTSNTALHGRFRAVRDRDIRPWVFDRRSV